MILTTLSAKGCVMMQYKVNQWLEYAIKETHFLDQGEIFLIKDLFKGYEWNRISRRERLLLGTLFLNAVRSSVTNIAIIEKTSSGQQRYKKL